MQGYTNATGGAPFEIQPFSYYATHLDELGAVLQAHYNRKVDLSTVWSVGDTMTDISLSAISASPSQSAQNIDLVILDFNHDTLSSDTSKKAAITVAQLDSLSASGQMNSNYNSYTYARYTNSPIRSYLNTNYKAALPSDLSSLIKPVNKVNAYPTNSSNNQTTETTSETCWLASNYEIFGATYGNYVTVQDGTQYPYYSTQSNRIKKLGKTGSANGWWSRSGFWYSSDSRAFFVLCYSDGSQSSHYADRSYGLSPCFAL